MHRLYPLFSFVQSVEIVDIEKFEDEAKKFVDKAEKALRVTVISERFASWAWQTNITNETKIKKEEAQTTDNLLTKKIGKEAQAFDITKIRNRNVKRKLKSLQKIGTAALPENKLKKFISLTTNMKAIWSTAKVLKKGSMEVSLALDPNITNIFAMSRNVKELEYYWERWREATGRKMKDMYKKYIKLYNEAAKLNGYRDASIMKVSSYESETFQEDIEETWLELKPLYQQLHAYVRNKLHNYYGKGIVENEGPIPAHLLGNMWAQNWRNILDIVIPFPDKPSINVTGEMVRQGWNQTYMFKKADEFFQSMGLDKMPDKFWSGSLIKKPDDGRQVNCHATAWDFYNGEDYRIKMCTEVNQPDF